MSDPPAQPRTTRRWRPLLAVLVAIVPLVPIVVALTLSGGGGPAQAGTSPEHFAPAGPAPTPTATTRGLSVPRGPGTLVALVVHPTQMHTAPGGRVFAHVGTKTGFGSPNAMWVARRSGRWLGVVSDLAGNNRLGWIPASATSLSRVTWELHVSLAARRLTVLDHGRTVQRYTIAVGAPASPTPTGRFAVTDRLNTGDPSGPYGCCILALSAVAPHAIQGWDGGNRVAIHSTPETSTIGDDVSHGCMRLTLPEGRWLLQHIPLGTPTIITS